MADKIIINIHSMVDLITNSSTELFCTIKGKTKQQVEELVKSVVDEFGCDAVEFCVYEEDTIWDEEKDDYIQVETFFEVSFNYETHHSPCGAMIKRLQEIFGSDGVDYV